MDLYAGAKATSPDAAVDGQELLARIALPSPAFSVSAEGAVLQGVPLTGLVVQTGSPTWARFSRPLADGGTAELDATVGPATENPDIVTDAAVLQVGSTTTILSFTLSL
jgi:hypothetical protein